VGYYNVTINSGATSGDLNRYKLVCMQLKPNGIAAPTLNNSFTNLPAGTIAYVWQGATWSGSTEYLGGTDGWETDYPVPYGTGVLLKNTGASPITATFVGDVMEGSLTNAFPAGYAPRGPLVPQAGGITTVHGFDKVGTIAYTWTPGTGWSGSNEYLGGTDGWENGEPTVDVGGAVMLRSTTGGDWVRNFTVPKTP
jgi:hypothetical protein